MLAAALASLSLLVAPDSCYVCDPACRSACRPFASTDTTGTQHLYIVSISALSVMLHRTIRLTSKLAMLARPSGLPKWLSSMLPLLCIQHRRHHFCASISQIRKSETKATNFSIGEGTPRTENTEQISGSSVPRMDLSRCVTRAEQEKWFSTRTLIAYS